MIFKNKVIVLAASLLLGSGLQMFAQDVNDNEITVKDKDGREEVIDVPESMGTEFDDLLQEYYSQKYLKVDDDCNYRDENRTYEPEVYVDRLKRLPNIMEMPYNDIVQKFIDRYTGRLRRSVSYMLGASNFYMPIFEDALSAYDIPLELKYLPVIESALNPKATSRVGAAGLWQFMPSTGKQYGLEINSLVDERRDPVKASYAAARYLRDLYKIYGDWSLVIAAYNCGPQNVRKAMQRAGGEADYWKIYPYLPRDGAHGFEFGKPLHRAEHPERAPRAHGAEGDNQTQRNCADERDEKQLERLHKANVQCLKDDGELLRKRRHGKILP